MARPKQVTIKVTPQGKDPAGKPLYKVELIDEKGPIKDVERTVRKIPAQNVIRKWKEQAQNRGATVKVVGANSIKNE